MRSDIQELFDNEEYDIAITYIKELLQSDSNNSELWYALFLADNKGYENMDIDNIKNEMAFNKACELATPIQREQYEKEYNGFKDPTSSLKLDNLKLINKKNVIDRDKIKCVRIPEGVEVIEDFVFEDCSSLKRITIPNSVTSIGNHAFYGCSSLTNIIIPNRVASIKSRTFYNCRNLKRITIPNSVTSIGNHAFYGCRNLISITISNSVTSIGEGVFWGCDSLTSIAIPNSVTSIGSYAFCACSSLTNITIPNRVTNIEDYAFYDCSNLTNITIPNRVSSIGDSAFAFCKNLSSITLPNSVTSIGEDAFYDCTNLTSIIIPKGVTNIGKDAFESCNNLDNVYYEGTIEDWCKISFSDNFSTPMCYAKHFYLKKDNGWKEVTIIEIPNGIKKIRDYQFYGFNNVASITIPYTVTNIEKNAFANCSIRYANIPTHLISYIPKSKLKEVEINSGQSIEDSAFAWCSSLTSITIPKSVISIGDHAFDWCSSLTNITIPDSVTSIGNYAFYGCSSLTSITIPKSVNTIGEDAFSYCFRLVEICNYSKLKLTRGSEDNGHIAYYAREIQHKKK